MPIDDELASESLYGTDGLHTLESARYTWPDAPSDDFILADLLEVAKEQCVAYAAELPEGTTVYPTRFRLAQLMQARNLWNSTDTNPSGEIGGEGFVYRPFPMDWVVKNILRPKKGVPLVG